MHINGSKDITAGSQMAIALILNCTKDGRLERALTKIQTQTQIPIQTQIQIRPHFYLKDWKARHTISLFRKLIQRISQKLVVRQRKLPRKKYSNISHSGPQILHVAAVLYLSPTFEI